MTSERHLVSSKAIIFNETGTKVLLPFYGERGYGLVGGHIDKDEHPDDAMRRELAEEIGSVSVHDLKHFDFMLHTEGKIVLIYTCFIDENEPLEIDKSELLEAVWVSTDDLMNDTYNTDSYQEPVKKAISNLRSLSGDSD